MSLGMRPGTRSLLRGLVHGLNAGGPGVDRASAIRMLRAMGAWPGENVGNRSMPDGSDACVAWFAGQLLDALEQGDQAAMFGIHAAIQNLDRFVPERVVRWALDARRPYNYHAVKSSDLTGWFNAWCGYTYEEARTTGEPPDIYRCAVCTKTLIAPDERLALPTIARERDPLDDDLL